MDTAPLTIDLSLDGVDFTKADLLKHDWSFANGAARFSLLTAIDTTRVPLHIAAGPAIAVKTDQELSDALYRAANGNVENLNTVGFLFGPETAAKSTIECPTPITEILVFVDVDALHDSDYTTYPLHALPLSSHLLYEPSILSGGQRLPTEQKRKLSTLFDQIADRRKRVRRRGGQDIAVAAAKSQSQPQSTAFGFPSFLENAKGPDIRVLEGRHQKQAPKAAKPVSNAKASGDSAPNEPGATVESRNRHTISKTVMAGLRVHGLQRNDGEGNADGGDDEFKAVYHNTFKAGLFSFVSFYAVVSLIAAKGHCTDSAAD